jgi:hypothetical protein
VCTVVVRLGREGTEVLALRDELVSRSFDDPGTWWPDQPDVIGGRDQVAGGSWCVTDRSTSTTALVLNRPQRRIAAPGAPSRGVLPLLAVAHGLTWPEHVDVSGMATFAVVLVRPGAVTVWDFAGADLARRELAEGTHMVTSGGVEDGKADRFLAAFSAAEPVHWQDLLAPPVDDRTALVVRHEGSDDAGRPAVFATVFGQRIGRSGISCTRRPWEPQTWQLVPTAHQ